MFARSWSWQDRWHESHYFVEQCIKPVVKTEFCEKAHAGTCLKGAMRVKMKSGEEFTSNDYRHTDYILLPREHIRD